MPVLLASLGCVGLVRAALLFKAANSYQGSKRSYELERQCLRSQAG